MAEQVTLNQFGLIMRVTITGTPGRYFALVRQNSLTRGWDLCSTPMLIGPSGQSAASISLARFFNTKLTLAVLSAADATLQTDKLITQPFETLISPANVPSGSQRFNESLAVVTYRGITKMQIRRG